MENESHIYYHDHGDGVVHAHTQDHDHEHSHEHSHTHTHTQTKAVLNRLSRAIGHLESVKRMVEDGRDCTEVLVQLAAVRSALNSTAKVILKDHLDHCIYDVSAGDSEQLTALNEAIAVAKTKFETRDEIGYMIADAIREGSGADFALQNMGGVRVNYLKKGPITIKDVYTLDPFNNEIVVYQMTGAQLKKFIINSYKKNGGYPSYVSGMKCKVTDDGRDINVFVTPDHGTFSTKTIYKVAFNSYMASTVKIESVYQLNLLFLWSATC